MFLEENSYQCCQELCVANFKSGTLNEIYQIMMMGLTNDSGALGAMAMHCVSDRAIANM